MKTTLIEKVFPQKPIRVFSYKKVKEVLTKLKFITTIEFDGKVVIDCQVIKFIVDLCPHLKHITIDKLFTTLELTSYCIEYFGQKCGPNLKSIYIYKEVDKNVAKLLSGASQLETLKVKTLSDLTKNELKFPKLKNISVTTKVGSDLTNFQDDYASTLESLTTAIDLKAIGVSDVSQLISGFGKMTNLRSLDISIMNVTNAKHILTGLTQIAKNCTQMTDLSICILFDRTKAKTEDYHLFQLSNFAEFTSLSYLEIKIQKYYSIEKFKKFTFGSLKEVQILTKLKHLSLDLNYLEDDTFKDFGHYLPQLESIVIKSRTPKECLSDKFLHHLSELRSLRLLDIEIHDTRVQTSRIIEQYNAISAQRIIRMGYHCPPYAPAITSAPPTITDFGIKQLLDNCLHLQRLVLGTSFLDSCLSITFKTIEEFISKARKNPRIQFQLSIDAKILNLSSDEISHSLNRMYNNLTIRLPLNQRLISISPNPIVQNLSS